MNRKMERTYEKAAIRLEKSKSNEKAKATCLSFSSLLFFTPSTFSSQLKWPKERKKNGERRDARIRRVFS